MLKKLSLLVLPAFALLALGGCHRPDTRPMRVSTQQDTTSEGVSAGSADYEQVANELNRVLMSIPEIRDADSPPTVAFLPIRNETSDPTLNPKVLRELTMAEVMKLSNNKVIIIERDTLAEVQAEREAKRAGAVTSSGRGDVYGADFFITGVITAQYSQSLDERGQFTVINLKIQDAETTALKGIATVKFKKVQSAAGQAIYQ